MFDANATFDALFDEPAPKGSSAPGPLDPDYYWPEAEPFNTIKPAKSFPLAALPVNIQNAVIATQALTQAPIEMVVASALSAASLATQGHANVARDAALVGPIGIYNITVGLSGERKSAIDSKLWAGCREAADLIRERRQQEIALIEPRMAIWESKREALQLALKAVLNGKPTAPAWMAAFHAAQPLIPGSPPAGPPSPQALTRFLEAELIAHQSSKPVMPKSADLLHADDTSEALAESLSGGWPVAALAEAEGGVVLGGVAMQKERVMQTFAFWNVLWDGGRIIQKRTSVESRRVRDVRMTINLMVQPEVLARVLNGNDGLVRDIGLQSRFLLCYPASTMGGRQYQAPTRIPKAIDDFNKLCFDLLVNVPLPHPIIAGVIDTTRVTPPVLPLSTTAHARWVTYYNRIERELTGRFDDVKDVASKAAEQAARIAGIFWVFSNGRAPVAGDEIDDATVMAAIAVAIWYLGETQRVLQSLSKSVDEARAEELFAWLLAAHTPGRILANEILRLGPPGTRNRKNRDAALAVLRARGLAETDKNDAGRRVVVLNPVVVPQPPTTP